jgi:hypothetical protein
MIVAELLVFLFYVLWGCLSLASQMKDEFKEKIKKIDRLRLIPNYKFFCPKPVRYDYHLYYKIGGPDSEEETWREIGMGDKNNFTCFIWNPQKRYRKIFYKCIKIMRRNMRKDKAKPHGRYYSSLLRHIRREVSLAPDHPLQIRIMLAQDLNKAFAEKEIYSSIPSKIKTDHELAAID